MSASYSGVVNAAQKDIPHLGETTLVLSLYTPVQGAASLVVTGDQSGVKAGSSISISISDPVTPPKSAGS